MCGIDFIQEFRWDHGHLATLGVSVPFSLEVDPYGLLSRNWGEPLRWGLILGAKRFALCMDFEKAAGLGEMETSLVHMKREMLLLKNRSLEKSCGKGDRVQEGIPGAGKWMERAHRKEIEISWFPEGCGRAVCAVRLPLVLFGTGGKEPEPRAPAYYALYLNTKMHGGSLFHDPSTEWGLCRLFSAGAEHPDSLFEAQLDAFIQLACRFQKTAWENMKKLYIPRFSEEFLKRNGLKCTP